MRVEWIQQSTTRLPRSYIERSLTFFVKNLKKRKVKGWQKLSGDLNLVFLDKVQAKKLNQQYRKRNYPTNVLSFSSDIPDTLGDLVFCPEVIKEEAQREGLSYRAYLSYLVLHGVLHLLGYDHEESKVREREMYRIQDGLFEGFNSRVIK
jgi:probable rRNA maturation factor